MSLFRPLCLCILLLAIGSSINAQVLVKQYDVTTEKPRAPWPGFFDNAVTSAVAVYRVPNWRGLQPVIPLAGFASDGTTVTTGFNSNPVQVRSSTVGFNLGGDFSYGFSGFIPSWVASSTTVTLCDLQVSTCTKVAPNPTRYYHTWAVFIPPK